MSKATYTLFTILHILWYSSVTISHILLYLCSLFTIHTSRVLWYSTWHWPTIVWLQLLLCHYQLIDDFCNLFSCNGTIVFSACWHVTIIVVITVIVIVKWYWHFNAFNGITTFIAALGVTLGICYWLTRMMQINISTSLVPEVLCTFRH